MLGKLSGCQNGLKGVHIIWIMLVNWSIVPLLYLFVGKVVRIETLQFVHRSLLQFVILMGPLATCIIVGY